MRPAIFISLFFLFSFSLINGQEADTASYKALNFGAFHKIVSQYDQYVLVAFKADWCLVCKKEAPVIRTLQQENPSRLKVLILDLEENPLLGHHYELDALPVHMIFSKGELMWNKVGLLDPNEIKNVMLVLDKKKKK
jgi:thioredoxin 1